MNYTQSVRGEMRCDPSQDSPRIPARKQDERIVRSAQHLLCANQRLNEQHERCGCDEIDMGMSEDEVQRVQSMSSAAQSRLENMQHRDRCSN